jgi:hypothetical protein
MGREPLLLIMVESAARSPLALALKISLNTSFIGYLSERVEGKIGTILLYLENRPFLGRCQAFFQSQTDSPGDKEEGPRLFPTLGLFHK